MRRVPIHSGGLPITQAKSMYRGEDAPRGQLALVRVELGGARR
jgi:hypothetical protein